MTKTLGEINNSTKNKRIKFQVVPARFQIQQKGILGVDFLKSQEATLKFKRNSNGELNTRNTAFPFENHTTIKLPARNKTLVTLLVKTNSLKTGYLKRIQAGTGVYIGEVLVTPKEGYIKIFSINSTPENIEVTLPPIELEEFDIIDHTKLSLNKTDPYSEKETAHAKRMCEIVKLLDFEKLNNEEKLKVMQIINHFPYRFHFPTDKLECANTVKHKIITTDEKVINVKQYRHPQIHKEKV